MRKGKKRPPKRDPTTRQAAGKDRSGVFLCGQEGFNLLVSGGGYRRLKDCPEVQMCVNAYASLIANMTLYLMENTDKGDRRVKNALSRRLDIEPSPVMTHQTFFTNLVRVMMLEGNQVTLPIYEGGLLKELCPVPPSRVNFRRDGRSYKVLIDGETFSPDEVLHFSICPDEENPWKGQGFKLPLRDVVKALGQANSTKNALIASPNPSIIVKVDGYSEKMQDPQERDKLSRQFLSSTENGRPWLIPADTIQVDTVKPVTLNDLAIKDAMTLDKRAIAALMMVPPFLVGVGEFKAAEFDWFVSTPLMAPARIIEQELTRKLVISDRWYWHFNSRSLLNYDIKKVVEAGKELVDRMALRRNELREWLGLTPDPEMEELLALENFIPQDRLGDQKKLKGNSETGGEDNEDKDE